MKLRKECMCCFGNELEKYYDICELCSLKINALKESLRLSESILMYNKIRLNYIEDVLNGTTRTFFNNYLTEKKEDKKEVPLKCAVCEGNVPDYGTYAICSIHRMDQATGKYEEGWNDAMKTQIQLLKGKLK